MSTSTSDGRSARKIIFTADVQAAIDQVLQNTDPRDNPDFNPIDHINQLFPTEQSLSTIDDVISKIECEISVIDDNIRSVVRGQCNNGKDGRMALNEAQKVIAQLFTQVTEVKTRAEQTEEMVKEITCDIKQLDFAKKNLTLAITTLNHLHMLVGGIESLQSLLERRLYGEILNPLQAITEVNQHFQQYTEIPQIKELSTKVAQIHSELATQISEDFHLAFSRRAGDKMSLATLTDGCLIVSVLDPKVKTDLLKWFINLQLQEYEQLFHENQDIAWLDKIDKRYAWLKRHLLDFESKFGKVFPLDWDVSERITVQFCDITRVQLSSIMSKRRPEIDVKLLLFAINKTSAFEQLLSKRFEGITLRLDDQPNPKVSPFVDLIGSCFKSYLDIYTDSIDQNLSEMIQRFVDDTSNKTAVDPTNKSAVFPSCADLFMFYKKCMVQCTQLSNGKPMYDLAMIFKKYLRQYATKILDNRTPKITTVQTSIGTSMSLITRDLQNLSTAAGQVINSLLKEGETPRYTNDQISKMCCILTTAEYCLETVQQLEEKLKEKVKKSFADKIDLSEEKDIFHRTISNCIQHLVQDLENGCEPALAVMSKIQWQNINNVGDQSPFINSIISHFKHTIPVIRDSLASSRKYYTQFCHKFVNSFIPKYIKNLYKCRPTTSNQDGVNNILGCEQLLLDTHSLKTVLLDLPSIASQVNRKAPLSYTKVVVKGMTKAEMIIKVVMTSTNPPQSFVEQCLKLLPECTLAEFHTILDMKGIRRMDQVHLVETFKRNAPVSESFVGDRSGASGSAVDYSVEPTDKGRIKKLEQLIKKRLPN